MIKYILGFFLYLFNFRVSVFARVDHLSIIKRKARIFRNAHIFQSYIDDYSYVGVGSEIVFAEVGRFCSIGNGCVCGLATHTVSNISTSPVFTEPKNGLGFSWCRNNSTNVVPYKKLFIGHDVWIGSRAILMGGIKIGNGAIIGAGAIVTKDVPPYSIVAGVPAKVIRYRFPDVIIERLNNIEWWNLDEKNLRDKISYFQQDLNDIDGYEKLKDF